jgi:hypothetical protein
MGSSSATVEVLTAEVRAETWRPVVGLEGSYEVSDLGNVRSLDRRVNAPQSGGFRLIRGRALKPSLHNSGYLCVTLCSGKGREQKRLIQALVLEAFAGPCPPGMESLHGPGGPLDNRWPENLRWGTRTDNVADMLYRDGTLSWAKLSPTTVAICHLRRALGASYAALAHEYGVSPDAVRLAVTGRTWKRMTDPGDQYTAWAVAACVVAVMETGDFAGWLSLVLVLAAAQLGSLDALTEGRPGSWEADLVDRLARGLAGDDDGLAHFRAAIAGQ